MDVSRMDPREVSDFYGYGSDYTVEQLSGRFDSRDGKVPPMPFPWLFLALGWLVRGWSRAGGQRPRKPRPEADVLWWLLCVFVGHRWLTHEGHSICQRCGSQKLANYLRSTWNGQLECDIKHRERRL